MVAGRTTERGQALHVGMLTSLPSLLAGHAGEEDRGHSPNPNPKPRRALLDSRSLYLRARMEL